MGALVTRRKSNSQVSHCCHLHGNSPNKLHPVCVQPLLLSKDYPAAANQLVWLGQQAAGVSEEGRGWLKTMDVQAADSQEEMWGESVELKTHMEQGYNVLM